VTTPTIALNNSVEMPRLGFGVFLVPPDEVVEPVRTALDAGYRLIDTATLYGNEEGVGRAITESGVARDELFVTTKVWNTDQGYDETLRAFDNSQKLLGLDVVDLYLIHWPAPKRDRYVETWKALER
jgi:2,5-diketo-D-gluconate reductase A